jgi:hypothetical protein
MPQCSPLVQLVIQRDFLVGALRRAADAPHVMGKMYFIRPEFGRVHSESWGRANYTHAQESGRGFAFALINYKAGNGSKFFAPSFLSYSPTPHTSGALPCSISQRFLEGHRATVPLLGRLQASIFSLQIMTDKSARGPVLCWTMRRFCRRR